MKITILGPAHPYRGGLASIMEIMARTFQRRGAQVDIRTFTLQYPALLFPGQSQTLTTPPPEDLHIVRCVNTVNPFNWLRVGRLIRRERPDFVLMKYWTPFMAPCFGTIARLARGNGHTKVICQIDNVEPHEHHFIDRPFNRYFLRAVDGFVYMSEQVHRELEAYTAAPVLFSPHPLFENFGERVDRREACVRLGLDLSTQWPGGDGELLRIELFVPWDTDPADGIPAGIYTVPDDVPPSGGVYREDIVPYRIVPGYPDKFTSSSGTWYQYMEAGQWVRYARITGGTLKVERPDGRYRITAEFTDCAAPAHRITCLWEN